MNTFIAILPFAYMSIRRKYSGTTKSTATNDYFTFWATAKLSKLCLIRKVSCATFFMEGEEIFLPTASTCYVKAYAWFAACFCAFLYRNPHYQILLHQNLPKSQCNFIDFIVRPCLLALCCFYHADELTARLDVSHAKWKTLLEIKDKRGMV